MVMRTQRHGLSLVSSYQDSPAGPFGGHATLANGLDSVWKMEDVTDSRGTNTLTNNNVVTFVAGKDGNAANFVAASSQSLSIPAASWTGLKGYDAWSVSTWLSRSIESGTDTMLDQVYNFGPRFVLSWFAGGQLQWNFTGDSGGTSSATTGAVATEINTWYHVVGTWDGTGDGLVRVYVNGSIAATAAVATGKLTTSNPSSAFFVSGGNYDGLIDETLLYSRDLITGEITALAAGLFY